MNEKYDLAKIKGFWADRAESYGQAPEASWGDKPMLEMEAREIAGRLSDGDRVLDAGCGNGYKTVELASRRDITIRGIDFVGELVAHARDRLEELPLAMRNRIEFDEGDITDPKEPQNAYDKVVVVRVLINLGSWQQQSKAIERLCGAVKPGGRMLISEATVQGWENLNRFRRQWGLPDIPVKSFNSYLDEDRFIDELPPDLTVREVVNFSSTYFAGTRVLKPLLIRALNLDMDVSDTETKFNRWFASLPSWGDVGTQKLFVLERTE